MVLETFIGQGETVFPGVALVDILDLSSLFVDVFIEEKEIAALKLGQRAGISSTAWTAGLFPGAISAFGRKAEFSPKYIVAEKERQALLYQVKVRARPRPGGLQDRHAGHRRVRQAGTRDDGPPGARFQIVRRPSRAVDDVSLDIRKAAITILTGADGAGKSTLFKMLVGLVKKDSGAILLNGEDIGDDYSRITSICGYMPEKFSLYTDLSVEENMNFFAAIQQVPLRQARGAEKAPAGKNRDGSVPPAARRRRFPAA